MHVPEHAFGFRQLVTSTRSGASTFVFVVRYHFDDVDGSDLVSVINQQYLQILGQYILSSVEAKCI